MSEITDVQRLLARGRTIQLADGASHEIRFGGRSLAQIEDDYGSLQEFTEALRAKPFRTLAYVIHLTLGVPKGEAIDLVDTRKASAYIEAIGDAIAEALGEQDAKMTVRIIQNHEVDGEHYRAGTMATVTLERAKHLLAARVAEVVQGNGKAAPGSDSPGAASSTSPSWDGGSTPRPSGA